MKTILIVDDEDQIRATYKQLLANEGYLVVEAASAIEANERLVFENVDVVLLDINIPEIDGATLQQVIDLTHPETRIIVSSVYPLSQQKDLIKGAADYYDKSQELDVLLEKIGRVLDDDGPDNECW